MVEVVEEVLVDVVLEVVVEVIQAVLVHVSFCFCLELIVKFSFSKYVTW